MILEFFGPAGSGKTTLASALALHLRNRGYDVIPIVGIRDNVLKRGTRRCLARISDLAAGGRNAGSAADLLDLLPPKGRVWAVRLHWHLARLDWAWNEARTADKITIFDQGMIQAVASLVMLSGSTKREQIVDALHRALRPDILVRLVAPRELLAQRLRDRWEKISYLQRLLEVAPRDSLDQISQFDLLADLLGEQDLPIINASSIDPPDLDRAIDKITAAIGATSLPGWLQTKARLSPAPHG